MTIIISQGKRFRECVSTLTHPGKKGKLISITFHQELIRKKWVDKNPNR